MSDNKSLQVKKDGIIERIFSFFRNIILKSKDVQTENISLSNAENSNIKLDFNERLKIKPKEESKILKIQHKYENEEIKLADLSNKEIHSLNILYQSQVLNLENILSKKLAQLNKLKNKNTEENS